MGDAGEDAVGGGFEVGLGLVRGVGWDDVDVGDEDGGLTVGELE